MTELASVSIQIVRGHRWAVTWAGIGLLGLLLRLVGLDHAPLDSAEAHLAFAAWQSAQGLPSAASTTLEAPLFAHLTLVVFWLFGANDASARLLPALAGAAASMVPALLLEALGPRAALSAGVLLATSPMAIELSRRAEPASLSLLLVALTAAGTVRVALDRPRWSLWVLAAAGGAALADEAAAVAALAVGAAALFAAARLWPRQRLPALPAIEPGAAREAMLLAMGVAVLGATGGLMELRGIGFLLGDLWGGLANLVVPPAASGAHAFELFAYAGPLLVAAALGLLIGLKERDRLSACLGIWTALLCLLAVVSRQAEATVLLLPVLPAALLGGRAAAGIWASLGASRMGEPGWSALAATGAAFGLLLLAIPDSVGAGRSLARPVGAAMAVTLGLLIWLWPRAWRAGEHQAQTGPAQTGPAQTGPAERWAGEHQAQTGPAERWLAVGAYALVAVSAMARVSFGGSALGSEPLRSEATHPAFRDLFTELNLAASLDPNTRLVIESGPQDVARWYGRSLPPAPRGSGVANAFLLRAADEPSGGLASAGGKRVPATVRAAINPPDLHPLGVARWLASRTGLFVGQKADVIVTRS